MMQQKSFHKLGAMLVTLTNTMSWLNILNFVMVIFLSWNAYEEKLVVIFPWLNTYWVIAIVMCVVLFVVVMEYAVLQPSRIAFSNQQVFAHKSPVRADLEKLKRNQKRIMEKLDIKNE